MNILMFGWEFPPIHSGGLGVACKGIVEGLIDNEHKVFLVLPKTHSDMQIFNKDVFKILNSNDSKEVLKIKSISSGLYSPYANQDSYKKFIKEVKEGEKESDTLYGGDIFDEVYRYAAQAATYAKNVKHDLIHTHDWLTAESGIQANKISDKPHFMHVHATEFDRSGENPNQQVYDMESRGMHNADKVIAVSEFTKQSIIKNYGVPEWKIDVVHNAVEKNVATYQKTHNLDEKDKIVLFLGRMTMQKGPDYFLKMAKKVLSVEKNVKFVIAGDGDMMEQVINMSLELGIEKNILFTGFLKGDDVAKAYSSADLYVMPSVSEPFGIAPLEAIRHGTPVLISKQSGVSEVIKNALRVDFWDIDEMATQVVSALKYPALTSTLVNYSMNELHHMSWSKQAKEITKVYEKLVNTH